MHHVIDIETCGLEAAKEFAEPIAAPANYKDPDKIAAYIAEKQAEQIAKAGLDIDLLRIVAIGITSRKQDAPTVYTAENEEEEADILSQFWKGVYDFDSQPIFVGFNCLGFDLPALMRRSQYLNVNHPRVTIDKYRTPHLDLMQRLTWNGLVRARSLKFYCKRFGLPVNDAIDGKDIPGLVADGQWDQVVAHVTSDVILTKRLAERLGLLMPVAEQVPA